MKKGKHGIAKKREKSKKIGSHKFLIVLLIFLLLICIIASIYFLIQYLQISSAKEQETAIVYHNSQIEVSRYVTNLDTVQILKVDMESCTKNSTIDIWLKNVSDSNVEACMLLFFLLDSEGNSVFGTNISLPLLEPNEEKNIKLLCSRDVSSAVDYEIQLDTK